MAHKANARLEGCRWQDIASRAMSFPVLQCLSAYGLASVGHSRLTNTGANTVWQDSPEWKFIAGLERLPKMSDLTFGNGQHWFDQHVFAILHDGKLCYS
jgi:hypothetical protein